MEDLKNSYLNEQGLRQERDDLRAENERLREDCKEAYLSKFRIVDILLDDKDRLKDALRSVRKNIPTSCETAFMIINNALTGQPLYEYRELKEESKS